MTVDDIVDIRPKPGGPLAVYESEELGLSPLMCLPQTTQVVEQAMTLEDAEEESAGMRTKEESMQRRKSEPRLPPRGYYQLKLILATYAALLHKISGDHFPLYKNVLLLFRILYHDKMDGQEHQFTRVNFVQLTWQVVEESRFYFNQKLNPDVFENGGIGSYPI